MIVPVSTLNFTVLNGMQSFQSVPDDKRVGIVRCARKKMARNSFGLFQILASVDRMTIWQASLEMMPANATRTDIVEIYRGGPWMPLAEVHASRFRSRTHR
jgi:hypothetical protein